MSLERAAILKAFGVTEEDMAALKRLEDANGYTASKAQAEADYDYFRNTVIPNRLRSVLPT